MKKRKLFNFISLAILSLTGFCVSLGALTGAWFTRLATHTPGWKSGSDGAYFAYGNGKIENAQQKDRPYGITRPLHLYNLAWLQYLGYFETNKVQDAYDNDNVYFELANDLDMTGWVLPPIGTKDHPFIGNFNGNGFKISNLTISNDYDSYNRTPYGILNNITKTQFKNNVNIIGLFGVVGNYNGAISGSYNTSANEIINTGINNLTVASTSTTTLAGLAAGYVNGSLEGVAVNNSYIDLRNSGGQAITSITNNISDYSLIGYAASSDYLAKLQSSTTTYDTPTVSNPFISQGGDEWGASIEMKKMYNTLHSKMEASNYYSFDYTSYEHQTRTKNADGTYTPSSGYTPIPADKETDTYNANSAINGVYFYKSEDIGTSKNGSSVKTANYTFANNKAKANLNDGTANSKYVGLSGSHKLAESTYTMRSDTVYTNGVTISDPYTGIYLSAVGSTLTPGTSSNAVTLYLNDSNKLFTIYNSTIYYLNNSNGTISLATSSNSTWTWDSSKNVFKTGSYYLVYYQNKWVGRTSLSIPSDTFYYVSNTEQTTYLGVNGTSTATAVNSRSSATKWYFTTGTNKYIYTVIGGTNYYISGTSASFPLVTSTSSSCYRIINSTRLYQNGTGTDYISLNGSLAYTSTATDLYFEEVIEPSRTLSTTKTASNNQVTTYTETNTPVEHYAEDTYFPLTWENDSTVNPSDKNTGYVIGGHEYENTSAYSIGDVRISSYYTTAMLKGSFTTGSSYQNSTLFAYSFNSSGNLVKIGDEINGQKNAEGYTSYTDLGFKKYYYSLLGHTTGSRVGLGNMLGASGTNPAYGLHFMNADISTNNLINVDYAKINGVEYTNYDLPRDAIDFNLKADGFINFFAATYFINPVDTTNKNNVTWDNSNNSFFSLHSIERNDPNEVNASSNTIDSIRQIAKIYKNTEYSDVNNDVPQYVYTYRDGNDEEVASSWDTGVRDDNGTMIIGTKGQMVFDTYWLTDPEYSKFMINALYYFEIPVNKGEFALGSTSGSTKYSRGWGTRYTNYNKNGAYLLYLDIGAGVKNSTAVTINEKSTTTTYQYNYPKGVDFSVVSNTTTGNYTAVLGGDTTAIVVPSGNSANTKYLYTPKNVSTDASLVVGPTTGGGGYTATYKTVDTVVKDTTNANVGIVSASSSVDVMEKEILYDLTVNTNNYTVTTQHIIDGVRGAITTVTTTESWTEEQIMTIAAFDLEGVNLFTVVYSAPIDSTGSNAIKIESTYNPLTHAYTINFVSNETNKNVDIMFTSLTLNQSYEEDGNTVNFAYTLSVLNNGVDTGVALGNITSANLNKSYTLVCGTPS